jgi:type II secretory ATPase GspE/PulE/Tfp pilus assembly ATPase PilB-like protein
MSEDNHTPAPEPPPESGGGQQPSASPPSTAVASTEATEESKAGAPPVAEDERARALAAWKRWRPADEASSKLVGAIEDVAHAQLRSPESLDALIRAADEELARKKRRGGADALDDLPHFSDADLATLLAARKRRRDDETRRGHDMETGRASDEEASRAMSAWKQWRRNMPQELREVLESPRTSEEEAILALAAWKRRLEPTPEDRLLEELLEESPEIPIHRIQDAALVDVEAELGVHSATEPAPKPEVKARPAAPGAAGTAAPARPRVEGPEDLKARDLVAGLGTSQSEEQEVARTLATRYRLEYVDLTHFAPDPEIFKSVPIDLMFRYNFLPYRKERGRLLVVMADPTDIPVVDEISLLLGTPIQPAVGTPSGIQECLKRGQGSSRVLEEAGESFKIQVLGDDDKAQDLSIDQIKKDKSPIIRLIDTVLFDALTRRASDIHIETQDTEVVIKYRIDGALQKAMKPIAKEHHSAIISRIKVMAELDIAEKRVPQDGRFRVFVQGRSVDFRVSIMPSVHGEDSVIRVLDKETLSKQFTSLSLDILGYDERELTRFRRLIREPYGMVLVTGPTGSGKTTTLYGALSEIKSEEDKIITIEDPVEYQLKGITQIPVNEKKGLTFARGLRSILRHDPDKVMVGEIRDAETAEIAINSALTGHLVFTTVHANNVIDVLGRFINMGIEPYNFVSALNCVLAQRLVRTICKNCKRKVQPTPELLAESGLMADSDTWVYEGAGCVECQGTGFKGRTAICELLDVSDRVRELILARKSSAEIKRAARDEGMVFMRDAAVTKALQGETTLQEINKVTFVDAF